MIANYDFLNNLLTTTEYFSISLSNGEEIEFYSKDIKSLEYDDNNNTIIIRRKNKELYIIVDKDIVIFHAKMLEDNGSDDLDWNAVAKGTPILVRNSETDNWVERYFAGVFDGCVCTYNFFDAFFDTNTCGIFSWKYAKLKEV